MGFAETWRKWWDRLAGRVSPTASTTDPHAATHARRPAHSTTQDDSGLALELEDQAAKHRRRGAGRAGFNPYSNAAGYEKPRNWDDVDTR